MIKKNEQHNYDLIKKTELNHNAHITRAKGDLVPAERSKTTRVDLRTQGCVFSARKVLHIY